MSGDHSSAHELNIPVAPLSKTAGAGPAAAENHKTPEIHLLTRPEISRILAETLAILRFGNSAAIRKALARLDEIFKNGNHESGAAIAAIVEFIRSGQDAATGESFVIGEGGILRESTTLRVFLMDRLGTLSKAESNSAAALEVAHTTLTRYDSPDEWAISMRNIAWFDPNSREFLVARIQEMLTQPNWRERPTAGMLEAFDFIVHTTALEVIPELDRLNLAPPSALGQAAAIALDRFSTAHPLALTTLLNQQPDLLSATPLQRADLFAHADLASTEQRQQVENYLLRADITPAEREKFLNATIQSGQFVSNNLITPSTPPETPAEAATRMITLANTLNSWMRDGRFITIRDDLAEVGNEVNRINDEISADSDSGGIQR